MTANILADIESVTGGTAPASFGTVPDCSVTGQTVQGTDSVLLLIGTVTIAEAADDTAEFRFSVNGSPTGSPIGKAFTDAATAGETHGMTIVWAVTGLSGGANSFALEWQLIQATPDIDTAKPHSFQVIEIVGGDASILVDSSASDSVAAVTAETNLFQSTSISVAGTGSILLLLGNVPMALATDNWAAFRFGIDDSPITNVARTGAGSDSISVHDAWSWAGFHMETGVSAGTHSFELKWAEIDPPSSTESGRLRTFQVVEITANASLLADLNTAGSWTLGAEANDPTLDTDQTVNSTSSVVLIAANAMIDVIAGDQAGGFRIGVDDASVGGYHTDFNDDLDMAGSACLAWAETGISGTHSFQLRGQAEQGTVNIHPTFTRTLQVLDLTAGDTFEEQIADTQPVVDEIEIIHGLGLFSELADTITLVDEGTGEHIININEPESSIVILDSILAEFVAGGAITQELADTVNVIDEIRYFYTLHRELDDSIGIVDELRTFYTLHREFDDSISIVDELFTEFILRTIRLSDIINVVDEARYFYTLHRELDDIQAVLDEIRYETFLHRFLDDSIPVVDEVRYETFLHRFLDDVITLVDEIQATFVGTHLRELTELIPIVDEGTWEQVININVPEPGIPILDAIQAIIDEGLRIRLSDTIPVVDNLFTEFILRTARLSDIINVVDELRTIYTLHRQFNETISVVDDPRYTYILHRLFDDTISVVDDPRYTYTLHREMADVINVVDELFTEFILRTARLSDIINVVDDPRYTYILHRELADIITIIDGIEAILEGDFNREILDTIPVLDDIFTEFTLRTARLSDIIPILDEPRYTFIKHLLLDDSSTVVDEPRYTYILHQLLDDVITLVDDLRIITTQNRFFSETIPLLDDIRYTYTLHRFLDDTQALLDEIETFVTVVVSRLLDDTITVVDELRIITTLHRFLSDTQSILDEPRYFFIRHQELSDTQPVLDALFRSFDIRKRLSDTVSVVDNAFHTSIQHRFFSDTIGIDDDVFTILRTIFNRLLSDSIGFVDEVFSEKFTGFILSVLVSPDPATICEFLTVLVNLIQVPPSATAEIAGQTKDVTISPGALVGKAVFRAFDLGFITDETVTVTADISTNTDATATVVDEADVLNALHNSIITALQNEPDFSEFSIEEEVPQARGFTGPTILLQTIAGGSETQGHGNFTVSHANFRALLFFPDGKFKNVGGDILDRSDLAQFYLGVLTKVLNNVDLSAFDIDEKRVFQQTHVTPEEDLKFWGCTAVLAILYKGICAP